MDHRPKCKNSKYKALENNIGEYVDDLGCGNDFLGTNQSHDT